MTTNTDHTDTSADRPPLAVGMWLGTHNRIKAMDHFRYGWRATDQIGASFRQDCFPNGLRASDRAESCVGLPRRPWPPAPES